MIIKKCIGYELKKEKPNTSEDFFNRSEVTYVLDGQEKTLHVLYVRYFDELINEFTPFEEDPIFKVANREVYVKDIVALVCLLKNPDLKERKRIYINTQKEFVSYVQGVNFSELELIFHAIEEKQFFELKSPFNISIKS